MMIWHLLSDLFINWLHDLLNHFKNVTVLAFPRILLSQLVRDETRHDMSLDVAKRGILEDLFVQELLDDQLKRYKSKLKR